MRNKPLFKKKEVANRRISKEELIDLLRNTFRIEIGEESKEAPAVLSVVQRVNSFYGDPDSGKSPLYIQSGIVKFNEEFFNP